MQKDLLIKALIVGFLILLLLIPLGMVERAIGERSAYRDAARLEIANGWAGPQQVIGPVLALPHRVRVIEEYVNPETQRKSQRTVWEPRTLVVFPETLQARADVDVERRFRGIYGVPVYRAALSAEGRVRVPELDPAHEWAAPFVFFGVSDARGFKSAPELSWDGVPLRLAPGSGVGLAGAHHRFGAPPASGETHDFELRLALAGTGRIAFAPLAADTVLDVRSSWPHPSFVGGFLPDARKVSGEGFDATWKIPEFATQVQGALRGCVPGAGCEELEATHLGGVAFLDPVDVYVLTERSAKYSELFIFLVFGAFAVFETLRRQRIHPVQYGMVGLGLAVFFLLELALAEHIRFAAAYAAAAALCVALLTFYVSHVLGGARRGLVFGGVLALVYAALYVVINAEDHALLLGSAIVFGALSVAMIATRHVDWYGLGTTRQPSGDA